MELHLPHLPKKTSRIVERLHLGLVVIVVSILAAGWAGWQIAQLWVDGPISDAAVSAHLLKLSTGGIAALHTTLNTYHHPAAITTLTSDPFGQVPTTTP